MNGNITNRYTLPGGDSTISGKLGLGSLTRTLAIETGSQLAIDATISGSADFTGTGGGTLLLYSATNTYGGTTTIQEGAIHLAGSTQLLGNTNGGTVVLPNGRLELEGVTNASEPLALTGGLTPLVTWSGWNVWFGPVALTGDCRFDLTTTNYADQLSLLGVVSGGGSLHKTGNGSAIRFGGATANTFTGGITLDSGSIVCEKSNNTPVLAGPLVIGLAGETNSPAFCGLLSDSQIPDKSPVKSLQSGTLKIENELTEILGDVEFAGGGNLIANFAGELAGIPIGPCFVVACFSRTPRW